MQITAGRPADRPDQVAAEQGDELTAELTASYWEAYDQRLAETRFLSVARQLPELIGRAIRLAWEANRRDTVAAIALNVTSGVLTGFALLATTGVLEALFAAGPTPHRVRAALPSLILVAAAVAGRAGLQAAGGWAQARLDPQVERVVEIRLLDLTTQVELAAFDDAAFYDAMQRARDRGLFSAPVVVSTMFDCVTGVAGIVAAASVVAVLQPILLVLLLLAELPSAWAAVRSARIEYMTNFALADSIRRKWMLADLMADRRTAAEMRSFTLRHFMLARVARLAAYARDAQLKVADRQATTRVMAQAAGGIATAGVYTVLGILLAAGAIPLAVAGTAVLAIRSAQASLSSLLYAVNRCYEEGLYFSDYLAFCADAAGRIPAPGSRPVPAVFDRITADRVTFTYPGAARPALTEVSVRVGRGEVIALVGENGSGKTTLAKILAGLYRPDGGAVYWDGTAMADVDPEQLRELIAVIAQDHANWPLTVRHNIAMGRTEDPDLLAQAAAASGADSVIAALSRGYDTLLDRHFKNGAELSGGQWQRIAAARGFYRSAPLLIMDEPTAALDARAEYALFTSIPKHAEHRSVLLITHRLASVRHADRIYVLHHGQVIEEGTHTELIARGGQYAELFNLQASQYVALQPDPLGFAAGGPPARAARSRCPWPAGAERRGRDDQEDARDHEHDAAGGPAVLAEPLLRLSARLPCGRAPMPGAAGAIKKARPGKQDRHAGHRRRGHLRHRVRHQRHRGRHRRRLLGNGLAAPRPGLPGPAPGRHRQRLGPAPLTGGSVLADGAAHEFGRDDRYLAALGPRLRPDLLVRGVGGKTLLTDEHALGLLDDSPGVQRALQLRGQHGLLLAHHHAGDEQGGQVGKGQQRQFRFGRPGVPLLGQHRHHSHGILVIGDRAGQHRPDAAFYRGRAERRPARVQDEILDPHQHLVVERRNTWTFPVPYLQLFQMPHPRVGDRRVAQVMLPVRQHQAGAVHGKDRMGRLDDPVHRLIDAHLPEAQLPELGQGVPHILRRHRHGASLAIVNLALGVQSGQLENAPDHGAGAPDDQAPIRQESASAGDQARGPAVHECGTGHVQDEPPRPGGQDQRQTLGQYWPGGQVQLTGDHDRDRVLAHLHLDQQQGLPRTRWIATMRVGRQTKIHHEKPHSAAAAWA